MTIPGRWDYQQCTFFFRSPRWNILTRCEPPCRWQLSFIPLTPCENTSPDPFFLIVLLTPWDDVVCHVFNILIMYCNQYIWSFFGSFGRWILHIKIQFILKILLQASGAIHSCLLWSNRSWATHHCRWKIKVCRKQRLEINLIKMAVHCLDIENVTDYLRHSLPYKTDFFSFCYDLRC